MKHFRIRQLQSADGTVTFEIGMMVEASGWWRAGQKAKTNRRGIVEGFGVTNAAYCPFQARVRMTDDKGILQPNGEVFWLNVNDLRLT